MAREMGVTLHGKRSLVDTVRRSGLLAGVSAPLVCLPMTSACGDATVRRSHNGVAYTRSAPSRTGRQGPRLTLIKSFSVAPQPANGDELDRLQDQQLDHGVRGLLIDV